MAEYLQAPPRRKALGLLADALTSGQEALNTVNLPYVGGLGGLLFGQAPQYLQDVSYGMPLLRGGNVATGGIGTLTPDTRMLDVATLPFVGAGAAKAGQVGAKTLGKEVARQVETGTGLIGSNVLDPRQFATAYHGSPYLFNKFDINKVGSGEGAQAYGHGMYFAENPLVAKEYQVAGGKGDYVRLGEKIVPTNSPEGQLLFDVTKLGRRAAINKYPEQEAFIKTINPDNIRFEGGNLYKVDIPDKYIPKMLDWDKPLSSQNKEIQPAINQALDKIKKLGGEVNKEKMTGKDLYFNYQQYRGNNPDFASEGLKDMGIYGIKYLDATSRGAGKGTNNFVVFDPSEVKILEKGLLK